MDKIWYCSKCNKSISDDYYQEILSEAGHPPLCTCQCGTFIPIPWSQWVQKQHFGCHGAGHGCC